MHEMSQARILEWIAIPFCKGSSQPRGWTQVSRIAGRVFIIWATREAHKPQYFGDFYNVSMKCPKWNNEVGNSTKSVTEKEISKKFQNITQKQSNQS